MKSSQLKFKAMKSKSKKDVIEYKSSTIWLLNWKSVLKKDFLTILKQKVTLNRFGQLLSHISAINMQKGDTDILLIENNKILLDNGKIANVFNETIV